MASANRPQQFAINSCFAGSTTPPSIGFVDFGFDAFGLTFCNDGPDRIFVNLATSSSACSTGTGFAVNAGEQFGFNGQAMPMANLCTTSSAGTSYRALATRW